MDKKAPLLRLSFAVISGAFLLTAPGMDAWALTAQAVKVAVSAPINTFAGTTHQAGSAFAHSPLQNASLGSSFIPALTPSVVPNAAPLISPSASQTASDTPKVNIKSSLRTAAAALASANTEGERRSVLTLLFSGSKSKPETEPVSPNTTAASSPPKVNNIKTILEFIPEKNVLNLRWSKPLSSSLKKLPFDGRTIMKAFKDKSAVMKGYRGLKKVEMVEVGEPESIKAVVSAMTEIADISYAGMGNEYGLLVYASAAGGTKFIVQKGGWFVTQVTPPPAIRSPEGEKFLLLGVIAHTHPSGAAIPSQGDHAAMRNFTLTKQVYSILVVPGGDWSIFDGANVYRRPWRIADQPITNLFNHK